MNMITMLEIATNHPNGDILIEAAKHKITGKWTSLMYLMRDGMIHKLMLSFDINEKFEGWETEAEAVREMEKVRDWAIDYYNDKDGIRTKDQEDRKMIDAIKAIPQSNVNDSQPFYSYTEAEHQFVMRSFLPKGRTVNVFKEVLFNRVEENEFIPDGQYVVKLRLGADERYAIIERFAGNWMADNDSDEDEEVSEFMLLPS